MNNKKKSQQHVTVSETFPFPNLETKQQNSKSASLKFNSISCDKPLQCIYFTFLMFLFKIDQQSCVHVIKINISILQTEQKIRKTFEIQFCFSLRRSITYRKLLLVHLYTYIKYKITTKLNHVN